MKEVLEALRFSYQRTDFVLGHAVLDDQNRARLIEARDAAAHAVQHLLGDHAAEFFLRQPDGYRRKSPEALSGCTDGEKEQ